MARSFKILFVTWVCLLSLVDFKTLSGSVLCFGDDGHIDLEISLKDKCGNTAESSASESTVTATDDHCGNCLDVPLFSQLGRIFNHQALTSLTFDFDALIPLSVSHHFFPVPISALPSSPQAAPAALVSLRTVRLLV